MKKKRNKITNNNTTTKSTKRKPVDKYVHFDDYFNVYDGRMHPLSMAGLGRLGKELILWSQRDDALVMIDFFNNKGIPKNTWLDWLVRDESFKSQYAIALSNIGSRREKGALNKTFSEKMVLTSLPMYDTNWKELEEWRSGLRTREQEAGSRNIVIQMEPFKVEEDEDVETNLCPEGSDAEIQVESEEL